MRKLFFVWLLPVVWMGTSLFQHRYPGDEYGMYAIGSIIGVYVPLIFKNTGVHHLPFALTVAAGGGVILAGVGWLMDWVRVRRLIWAALFAVAAISVFVLSINYYPSIERALRKNGSWQAYIFYSINVGLYLSIIAAWIVRGAEALWHKFGRSGDFASNTP